MKLANQLSEIVKHVQNEADSDGIEVLPDDIKKVLSKIKDGKWNDKTVTVNSDGKAFTVIKNSGFPYITKVGVASIVNHKKFAGLGVESGKLTLIFDK